MSYSDPCPSLKSVSNHYIILGSMSFQSLVPSNLCPLMSHPDLCPLTSYSDLCPPKYMFPQICDLWHNTQIKVICQKKYPHRSVSTFWTERKTTLMAINSRIHIWDTHWLLPVWYQLISCIIYPFMLCMFFFFFLAISDLTAVCMILCTRPRIDLWIYFKLIALILIRPVTIRPSVYEIFVFSFFYRLLPHGHLFHISVFFYLCDR
jgi:hypothetical protein